MIIPRQREREMSDKRWKPRRMDALLNEWMNVLAMSVTATATTPLRVATLKTKEEPREMELFINN